MDFFAEQDRAKRSTWWLMVVFCVVLLLVAGLVFVGIWLSYPSFYCQVDPNFINSAPLKSRFCFEDLNWRNAVSTVATVMSLLGMMSIIKYSQLASGGRFIAEGMGGRQLNVASLSVKEKRLLNVVEEISIAAGCPVPLVYVIDSTSINAFAAGTTVQNAVIGVTSGAVDHFTRDELQAVIGHEFSHILNGDMKLNMNLIGACHGILGFYYIGRSFFRIKGGSNKRGTHPYLIVGGLGLMAIGAVGYFIGSLIKAGVSRQREFLADASSVQFTRNPRSMESALKKTVTVGSIMSTSKAAEVSHMLFSDGIKRMVGGIFATHPPLVERLKKINPHIRENDLRTFAESYQAPASGQDDEPALTSGFMPDDRPSKSLPSETTAAPAPLPKLKKPSDIVQTVGTVSAEVERKVSDYLKKMDPEIQKLAHESYGARALIFALLISENKAAHHTQGQIISRYCGADVLLLTEKVLPLVGGFTTERLPLIDLCIPALRNLSIQQMHVFMETLQRMIEEDKQVNLFEFTLYTVVKYNLHKNAKDGIRKNVPKVGAEESIARIISSVVRASSKHLNDRLSILQLEIYRQTLRQFPKMDSYLTSVPPWDIDLLESALNRAASFSFSQKKYLLEKLAETAAADDIIGTKEVEIIRGIGLRMACPIPPVVAEPRQIAVA